MKSPKPAKFGKNLGNKAVTLWLCPVIAAIVTCLSFLPVLRNGFVEWDDLENLVDNPHYRGLGWHQLRWMFTTFHMGPYQPLSWMTLGLDYWIWEMNPTGYHLTNLLIHTANGVFLYFISRRLLSVAFSISESAGDWRLNLGAAFSSLLFAVHPLRVESVAWATERRDVLSGFFYLWTIDCYLRAQSSRQAGAQPRRWTHAALAVYLLSLLSKATAITLPFALIIVDIYPFKRLPWNPRNWFATETWGVLREKLPFVILASLFAAIALFGQQQASAFKSLDSYGVGSRLAQVLFGASFYLWNTLVPWELSPLYEIPPDFSPWNNTRILLGATATVAITLLFYRLRHRWPAGLSCWLYSVIVLSPFLGIIQAGPQLVADRYSYLSCLSWAVLAGGILFYSLGISSRERAGVRITLTVAVVAICLLTSLTWRQTQVWRDTATLWNRVLELDPNSSIAHYNLGRLLAKQGKEVEAMSHYRRALSIRPDEPDTHNNLGLLLARQGDVEASLRAFRKAAEIDPNYAKAFFNIGRVLTREGDLENAVRNFERALALSPKEPEIHLALGTALAARGNLDEAIDHVQEASLLRPDFADAHVALARMFAAQGRGEQAEFHYRAALKLLEAQPRPAQSP